MGGKVVRAEMNSAERLVQVVAGRIVQELV